MRLVVIGALVLILGAAGYYWHFTRTPGIIAGVDPKNATYTINGKPVTLIDGSAAVEDMPTSKTITAYFGNEARGDLDADGDEDVAAIVIQNGGGSGTFVYAIVALKTDGGYVGTNGILLGDRIAPQTTEIRDGIVIVNYADRKPGEAMVVRPSVGVSLYARVDKGRLVTVE